MSDDEESDDEGDAAGREVRARAAVAREAKAPMVGHPGGR